MGKKGYKFPKFWLGQQENKSKWLAIILEPAERITLHNFYL